MPALQKKQAIANKTEADQAYPDVTFPESWTMSMGNETISARYYGPGHTSGGIVVSFEKANVVHMGGLMFNRVHPFVDRAAGASIANWITILEKVPAAHAADTTYIVGHGKDGFGVIGTQADLKFFHDYFMAVLDTARKGIQAGQSKEEITKLDTLPGFPDHVSPIPLLSLGGVLGVAYDELTAK